jgi:hypothetical protein
VNKPPQKPANDAESVRLGGAQVSEPDAPPSEEEMVASDALRRALENPSLPNEAAELARAVSLAHRPRPLDAALHAELLENALRGAEKLPGRKGGKVVRVFFGVSAALAVAASVALVVGTMEKDEAPAASILAPAVVASSPYRARSTQPLFSEPFDAPLAKADARSRPSSGSARVDRIAIARASDFRENEFSRWGAR